MGPNLPTRILIIEDDQDDFLIIEACIKDIPDKAFRIDWCYDYNEALNRISQAGYDIYFVDYLLGEKGRVGIIAGGQSHGL
jgi:DNA-binding response OmpR family regulator